MRKFKVLMTAEKEIEITLDDDDLNDGESYEDAAEQYAIENAFFSRADDKISDPGWSLTVEEVRSISAGQRGEP